MKKFTLALLIAGLMNATAWADCREDSYLVLENPYLSLASCQIEYVQNPNDVRVQGLYGQALWLTGQTDNGIALLRQAAQQNDVLIQDVLSAALFLTEQYEEGLIWLKKAANAGHPNAQHNLSVYYIDGLDNIKPDKPDYKEGLKWLKKAVAQNYPASQQGMGYVYENGYGVKKDLKIAKEWYQKACQNGEQVACDSLQKLK